MDAFDADALIYAAIPDHGAGDAVRALLAGDEGVGSVLLLPEVLTKPMRAEAPELQRLLLLLGRLDLRPVDEATATLAVSLGASYGLRAIDAVHLATAVNAGADRFVTNNRRDFRRSITEIDIVHPDDLVV